MDPRRGAFLKRGEAAFFLAEERRPCPLPNRVVGTICAAVDWEQVRTVGRRECVFGFFETINSLAVARALIGGAEAFARAHNLDSLIGPFNLDYEDGYGILVEGRDRPPAILCGHTPAYYQRLVESLGFVPARAANLAFAVEIAQPPPELERIRRAADLARRRGHYHVRGARFDRIEDEIDRIHRLLNDSLSADQTEAMPWPREAVESLVRPFREIADPELVLFVERASGPRAGETVGWFPGIPNLNEVLIHLNGMRYPWDFLRYLQHRADQPECLAAKSLLVLPQDHHTGAAALLFDELQRRATEKGYRWIDLSLTSAGNPQTPLLAERAGAYCYKRYQVYRRPVSAGSTIWVVAAIIEKDGEVLVARRGAEKYLGGYWEFPGGKVEANESPREALEREIWEELGMRVEVGRALPEIDWVYPELHIRLMPYECRTAQEPHPAADRKSVV